MREREAEQQCRTIPGANAAGNGGMPPRWKGAPVKHMQLLSPLPPLPHQALPPWPEPLSSAAHLCPSCQKKKKTRPLRSGALAPRPTSRRGWERRLVHNCIHNIARHAAAVVGAADLDVAAIAPEGGPGGRSKDVRPMCRRHSEGGEHCRKIQPLPPLAAV